MTPPPPSLSPNRRPTTPPSGQRGTHLQLPASPTSAASVGLNGYGDQPESPSRLRPTATRPVGNLVRTVSAQSSRQQEKSVYLELYDGEVYEGVSFGADKSVAGELVFQTGMVGYPESITDPSYRGQILVITFPLVGNYGVPSRTTVDELLGDLPKHFESSEIHIAGLVTASYSGEEFSHHLAKSSLGTWLKEHGVPAMCGVDTRALTKRIRERGSMLGRMLQQRSIQLNGAAYAENITNGSYQNSGINWKETTDLVDWIDPNQRNLVRDGEIHVLCRP